MGFNDYECEEKKSDSNVGHIVDFNKGYKDEQGILLLFDSRLKRDNLS